MACAPRAHGRPFRLWGRRRGRTIEIINERIVERDVAGDAANTKRLMKPAQRTRDPSMSLGQFPFVGRFQGNGPRSPSSWHSIALARRIRYSCVWIAMSSRSRAPRMFKRLWLPSVAISMRPPFFDPAAGKANGMRRMHAVHEEDFPIVLQGCLELLVPHDPRFLRLAVGLVGNADWFVSYDVLMCFGSGPPSIGSETLSKC